MNKTKNHSTGSNTGNYTVLIVDDNSTNLRVLSDYLTGCGFTTLIATDGELALQRAEYAQPNIILLDILIPGMDGFEICRRLKANEATQNVPVIFMTALTETEDKIKGLQMGAVDYITKPFHRKEVLARINTQVRLRELSEQLEQRVKERTDELAQAVIKAKRLNQQLEQEIAERVQAENAIRESEERYRKLVGLSFDGVVIHSQGHIDFVNAAGAKILGTTDPVQLVGKPLIDIVHPDYQTVVEERIRQIQEKGIGTAPIEEKFIRLDGTVVDVEAMGIPITYQSRPAVHVVFRDITTRKRAEEERLMHMHFLENLEQVDSVIRQAVDLEHMMSEVLEAVLAILQCDCVYFLYPCDPNAPTWSAPMEATRPEYPGAFGMGQDLPMTPELAASFQEVLESEGPVVYDPKTDKPLPDSAKQFSIQSAINIALYPRTGKPWLFGVCQCSHTRVWTDEEQNLLLEISHRIEDSLSILLFLQSLQESEETFRLAMEATHDGLWDWDIITNHVYYSPGWGRIIGYDPSEAVTKYEFWESRIHPEDRAATLEKLDAHLQGHLPLFNAEHRLGTKDREWKWVHGRGRVVKRDDNGTPLRMVGTMTDITERKQAEEEREQLLARIQEQIQQVQQIMNTVPEGVLLMDVNGQILLANPMAEKNLAILADANVGDILTYLSDRPLEELLTSPPQGLWHDVTAQEQHFQIIARSIEVGPTPGGWVMVIRDVTQQREFERRIQQQERLASVGQLAAGIAHDFNNIMATIVLYAQMTARAKDLPERIRDRMATISQQANHATNLIRQILDFSRRSVLERHPFDLLPFLKEQVQLLKRTLPENIVIKLGYGPDEYTVNADPTRMQQMVTNLAVNARDAMPEGGEFHIGLERIEIKPRQRAPLPEMQAGEWIQVTVSDTGTGISPDALPHIFDPFFTTKEPGEGSGLGLAQVHGIVGQHEGHITLDTHLGKGTTFTIYLPTLPAHPLEPSALEIESLPQGQGETILVIEDNVTAREALVESLTPLNYRVVEATNGQQALEILEQRSDEIALVVSDVVMPQMGGIALFHALRERELQMPMLMLTGHPMERELESLRTWGLSEWLLKPPNLEELATAVSQALKKASPQ